MAFDKWKERRKIVYTSGSGGAFYALGMLGVLVYYIQLAHGFSDILLAFVKAIFWPAFLAFRLYGFLGM